MEPSSLPDSKVSLIDWQVNERLSFSRRSRDATNVLHRQESITYGSDHAMGVEFGIPRTVIVN